MGGFLSGNYMVCLFAAYLCCYICPCSSAFTSYRFDLWLSEICYPYIFAWLCLYFLIFFLLVSPSCWAHFGVFNFVQSQLELWYTLGPMLRWPIDLCSNLPAIYCASLCPVILLMVFFSPFWTQGIGPKEASFINYRFFFFWFKLYFHIEITYVASDCFWTCGCGIPLQRRLTSDPRNIFSTVIMPH